MKIRAAGILIYRTTPAGPEILLLKSSKNGKWSPTKGQADSKHESDKEVALRETFEESGVKEEQLKFVQGFEEEMQYKTHGMIKNSTYFVAEILDRDFAVKVSFEHTEFVWADETLTRELLGRRTGQGWEQLLDKVFANLKSCE